MHNIINNYSIMKFLMSLTQLNKFLGIIVLSFENVAITIKRLLTIRLSNCL